jgi:hypothetical protein
MSKTEQIQQSVYQWVVANSHQFNAPYGILEGQYVNGSGRKYRSVTFGRSRTLDATVNIYGDTFIQVRTSRHGSQIFKNVADMQQFLDTL